MNLNGFKKTVPHAEPQGTQRKKMTLISPPPASIAKKKDSLSRFYYVSTKFDYNSLCVLF
jgi:hypothetical protein